EAVMVQLPAPVMWTVPGAGVLTVQLPLAPSVTAKLDEAVGETTKSASPNVLPEIDPNVIDWFNLLFVRLKLTVGMFGPTLATTLYEPPIAFAVKVGAVATPLPSVFTVAVSELPGKVPLAPLFGAVNVTPIPEMGFPELVNVAFKAVPRAELTFVFCPEPAVTVNT